MSTPCFNSTKFPILYAHHRSSFSASQDMVSAVYCGRYRRSRLHASRLLNAKPPSMQAPWASLAEMAIIIATISRRDLHSSHIVCRIPVERIVHWPSHVQSSWDSCNIIFEIHGLRADKRTWDTGKNENLDGKVLCGVRRETLSTSGQVWARLLLPKSFGYSDISLAAEL